MLTLKQKLMTRDDFLIGVELVTTRGTMKEQKARQTRRLAADLGESERVDWVSITDNAGGNPMLSPMALGKNLLYGGKEVMIHLSCKDYNRHGLESEAWQLGSEGFHNILALTGDYPGKGYHGQAKPVFDIDSVALLTLLGEMNRGLGRPSVKPNKSKKPLEPTDFFLGAVATNFKRRENEVVPQYLKMEKKLEVGAQFIIAQIGFDSRKSHEMLVHLKRCGHPEVPLIGNVYLLSLPTARFFRTQKIPGVIIGEKLLEECEKQARGPDGGKRYFQELAAKQIACFRGMGFRGAYLGGVHSMKEIREILDLEAAFSSEDWRQFAREIRYPQDEEFYLYAEDEQTGLADPERLHPAYVASHGSQPRTRNVTAGYRFSRWIHDRVFLPHTRLYRWGRKLYTNAKDKQQGPALLRAAEHAGKSLLYRCKDCGDCSLPDIAFLCPESQCAKNQRNGPCGGTRDGLCEVDDFECIWARAYDRLKFEGKEMDLLEHAPVTPDEALRGTSSWANQFLGRDHHGKPAPTHSKSKSDSKKESEKSHE